MKGYRVVLPPKGQDGHYLIGRGVKVFTPEGHELSRIGDFNLEIGVGDIAMLTVSLPVSVVEHEAEYPGILKAGDKVIGGDQ